MPTPLPRAPTTAPSFTGPVASGGARVIGSVLEPSPVLPYTPLSQEADVDYERQWGVPPRYSDLPLGVEPDHPPISSITTSSSPDLSLSNPDWSMSGTFPPEDPFNPAPASEQGGSGNRPDSREAPRSQNGRRSEGERAAGEQN